MEGLEAVCCGLPALVGLAILYARVPRLRPGLLVLGGLGTCLFLGAASLAVYDETINGPVVDAVQNHDSLALKRALDAGGSAKADVGGDFPWPVLLLAIEYGDDDLAKILLARGADPNAPHGDVKPLEAARGNPDLIKLLRRYGAH